MKVRCDFPLFSTGLTLRNITIHINEESQQNEQIEQRVGKFGFCFTLRALRSWKSFKTVSLVDDNRALVVKQALLFKGGQGLQVEPNKGLLLFGFRRV